MTAKEFLSQARTIKLRLETMAEQLVFLKSAAEYAAPCLSKAPRCPRNPNKNEAAILRVLEMEERMAAAREKLNKVSELIDKVPEPTQQAILVKRYLSKKTWADISREMYYSVPRIYEMHRDALNTVQAVLDNHSES